MPRQHYYLLSALPALGTLGADPPIARAELLAKIRELAGPEEIVEAILLGDDLLQREAAISGEIDPADVSPAVLTQAQAVGEDPLPGDLAAGESEPSPAIAADAVWAAYYRHLADVARRTGSAFLIAWTGFEVALRNALATERARALGLEPQDYRVAKDLADPQADLSAVVREWAAAPDAMIGLRAIDKARWEWITDRDGWFTFADDELAAYAAKLSLLHRWRRMNQPQAQKAS